jgi:ATP-dependent protease ClpP protease subunit
VRRDTDRDFYMDANEAIEYGIVDKILVRTEEAEDEAGESQRED